MQLTPSLPSSDAASAYYSAPPLAAANADSAASFADLFASVAPAPAPTPAAPDPAISSAPPPRRDVQQAYKDSGYTNSAPDDSSADNSVPDAPSGNPPDSSRMPDQSGNSAQPSTSRRTQRGGDKPATILDKPVGSRRAAATVMSVVANAAPASSVTPAAADSSNINPAVVAALPTPVVGSGGGSEKAEAASTSPASGFHSGLTGDVATLPGLAATRTETGVATAAYMNQRSANAAGTRAVSPTPVAGPGADPANATIPANTKTNAVAVGVAETNAAASDTAGAAGTNGMMLANDIATDVGVAPLAGLTPSILDGSRPINAAAEKTAVGSAGAKATRDKAIGSADKKFLVTNDESLATPSEGIGTRAAQVASVMPVSTFSNHNSASDFAATAVGAAASTTASDKGSETQAAAPMAEVAQRAVEAVMSVADLSATRQQHAVNLQFSVGGTPLEVRVEMRAGEVHTTFRTDSNDLRAALSDAWQSASASSDKTMRLITPVFAPGSSSYMSSDTGGSFAQQQRQAAGQEQSKNFALAGGGSNRATESRSVPATAPATSTPSLLTTLHLHTFA